MSMANWTPNELREKIEDLRAQVEALTKERDEAIAACQQKHGVHPSWVVQVSSLTSRLQTIEGEALERAEEAAKSAVLQTQENEDRAVSKGSASYDRVFFVAAACSNIGDAIRALRSDAGAKNG